MLTQWSENIALVEIGDEPAFSEEILSLSHFLDDPAAEPSHVVLNFSGVTYLNSTNLGQLLKVRRQLGERGRTMIICSVCDEVMSIIRVTGLDKLLRVAPDPMTALAGLQIEDERA
ncbi:MAG: STAS domain-containing protein [Phycisphaeraceae bacterium]|nr:STAS domain-containing protein [Phycisphaeraceae bacterium]